MYKLGYSIIANKLINIESIITDISFIDFFHIDIMDGNFVDNITIGPSYVKELKSIYPNMFFDCHLMVNNPKTIINELKFVDRISIHIENTNLLENVNYIKSLNLNFGIVINPDTSIENIDPYIYLFGDNDIIQIMTVYPGKCGQIFLKNQVDKIVYIKNKYPNINIQIDGGINLNTIDTCIQNGATFFVCGSSMLENGSNLKNKLRGYECK
jgi:ribulose-phosphate 3-epimerase